MKTLKEQYIQAHRELMEKYERGIILSVCPLCHLKGSCLYCTQSFCADQKTFDLRSFSYGLNGPLYRARYHRRMIRFLETVPAKKFQKKHFARETFWKKAKQIDKKVYSEYLYEEKNKKGRREHEKN
jgi:hypothetical protein